MKKKLLFSILCIFIFLVMFGCGEKKENNAKKGNEKKKSEVIIKNEESGMSFGVNEIPYEGMKYNDETVGLKNINFYRSGDSDSGYVLYSVIELDFTKLNEDSVYELMKENDGELDKIRIWPHASCMEHKFYDDENKEQTMCDMDLLGYEYDKNHALLITYNPKTSISCDFSDSIIGSSIGIKQRETYIEKNIMGETEEMNVEHTYDWLFSRNGGNEISKNGRVFKLEIKDEIPSNISEKIEEWIENKKEKLEEEYYY